MSEDLIKLYNTLKLVETKGDSTLMMADCLHFLEQLIERSKEKSELSNN